MAEPLRSAGDGTWRRSVRPGAVQSQCEPRGRTVGFAVQPAYTAARFPSPASGRRLQGVPMRPTRTDFYQVDSLLTEEERQIRDHVGDWVDDRYLGLVEKAYDDAYFPAEVIPEIAEMGLLGATLPEKYGCAGVNPTAYGLTMQELERGDSGLRSFASVQGSLAMWPIFAYGSEEQRMKWLPRMATGEVIGCFGLTEPDFGSNPGGMITHARKADGGYVLNGAK